MAVLLLGPLALAAMYLVVRACLLLITVAGSSMAPTLHDGDRALVLRRWAVPWLRSDRIVVARVPATATAAGAGMRYGNIVIKRVAGVAGDPTPYAVQPAVVPRGHVFLVGDCPTASFDSRHFGAVAVDDVIGVVVTRFASDAKGDAR